MTEQVFSAAPRTTGRAVRSIIRQWAFVAIGAGLGAISVSAAGADQWTGYSRTVALPSHSAPAARRSIPAPLVDPVDPPANRSVPRTEVVDRLYDEVMHSSGCALALPKASICPK
jgi:hypothetical protein